MEVPGVSEKDIKVEITDNTMIIRGEKKLETEEKDTNYYRVELSYGALRRVLCLPEDAVQDDQGDLQEWCAEYPDAAEDPAKSRRQTDRNQKRLREAIGRSRGECTLFRTRHASARPK